MTEKRLIFLQKQKNEIQMPQKISIFIKVRFCRTMSQRKLMIKGNMKLDSGYNKCKIF